MISAFFRRGKRILIAGSCVLLLFMIFTGISVQTPAADDAGQEINVVTGEMSNQAVTIVTATIRAPEPSGDPGSDQPKTGDSSGTGFYVAAILLASGTALVLVGCLLRQKS